VSVTHISDAGDWLANNISSRPPIKGLDWGIRLHETVVRSSIDFVMNEVDSVVNLSVLLTGRLDVNEDDDG